MSRIPPPSRRRRHALAALPLLSALLVCGGAAAQQPFLSFGARSVALGGATVGLASGASAALDNPAAIGDAGIDVALSAGGAGTESGDFLRPLRTISGNDPVALASGASPGSAADVVAALKTLSDPGNGVLGDGRAGAVLTTRGWALTVAALGWSGVFARTDLVHVAAGSDPATSFRNNTSRASFRALVLEDVALSKAWTGLGGRLSLGGSVHVLRGTTSSKEESVFTTDAGDALQLARRSTSGVERTSTRVSADAGVLVTFGVVRVGGVVKAINRPDFPFDDATGPLHDRGLSVTYGRQARVGAAVHLPIVGLVAAVDADLTKNETLVDGLKSQQVGGGVEWTIGLVAARLGVSVNLESPDRSRLFSGGAGVGIGPVHADAAVTYRPDRGALGALVTARVKL